MATTPMPKRTSAPDPKAAEKKREAQRKKRNAARRAAREEAKRTAAKQAAKTAGRQAAVKAAGRAVPVVGTAMAAGAASKRVIEDHKKMTNEKPDLSLTPGSAAFSRRMKAIKSNIAEAKRTNNKAAVKSLEARLKRMEAVAPKSQTKAASKPKIGGFAATKKAAPALKISPAKKEPNYNVGVSKGGVPFAKAFDYFRKQGKKEFTWNGKRYTTKTKEEVNKEKKAAKAARLKKTTTAGQPNRIRQTKRDKEAGLYVGPRQEQVRKQLGQKKKGGSLGRGMGVALRGGGKVMK